MKKGKLMLPEEWKCTIKESGVKLVEVARLIGMDIRRFYNVYGLLICIPDDMFDKFRQVVVQLKKGTIPTRLIDRSSFKGRIVSIMCNVCKNRFEPYDDDLFPVCQRCLEMKGAIRKEMTEIYGFKKKQKIKTNLYKNGQKTPGF